MPETMSTSSQTNGKKSSNSSIVNTPASTPLTNTAQVNNLQNSPPPNNNAPKYGTLVPNRIFVGGISANTTEGELMQLFSTYGTVKAAKIIQDRAGVSKGYGFITFESEDDAKRPLREAENIVLRERKLNIAPAIKKQPFSRAFDASTPPAVAAGNPAQFFFPPGAPVPYFQGGVAYYPQPAHSAPGDPNAQTGVYQTPTVYPGQTGPPQAATYPSMMFPTQTIYMPQQYPLPMPYDYNYFQNNGAAGPTAQYIVGNQGGPGGSQCTPIPSSSSPTRPTCYNQQIPTYNPTDPMFYNLPVYSTTIEGPPIYSEAFELSPAGPYAEESFNGVPESFIAHPEIDMPMTSTTQVTPITEPVTTSTTPNFNPSASVTNNSNNTTKTSENDSSNYEDASNVRNSSTPVVSLLSLDQQQEKDLLSMQGGRRRKPTNPPSLHGPPVQCRNYPSNGYVNPYGQISYHTSPSQPYHTYNSNFHQNRPSFNSGYQRRLNGFDNRYSNNKIKKKTFDTNKTGHSNDHSSRSSLRTDSNSSASCVDENKNEEKTHIRTAVNTPPPAPYSPLANPFKVFSLPNYNITNNYSRNPNPKFNHNRPYYNSNNNNNYCYEKCKSISDSSNPSKNGGANSSNNFPSDSQQNLPSQVHVATSQGLVPSSSAQGFSGGPPNPRRSRRSIRRSGGGGGVNEIGAGDAPLLSEVGGEVCKKLETLKL